MNRTLAQGISMLFHPAIYPLLGIFFVFRYLPYHYPRQVVVLSLLMVFVGTYLIPVLLSILLYRFKIISSLMMTSAKDRQWPYAFGAIAFYFSARFIHEAGLANEAYHFLLGSSAVIVLHLALLTFMKPSAHMAGIAGFIGLLIAVSAKFALNLLPFIAGLFLVAGLIAVARLSLKAHDNQELWIGFVSGLLLVFSAVYFLG